MNTWNPFQWKRKKGSKIVMVHCVICDKDYEPLPEAMKEHLHQDELDKLIPEYPGDS